MPEIEVLREALAQAREHAQHSAADIGNAQSRIEHIRLTTLAAEARNLVHTLETVERIVLARESS